MSDRTVEADVGKEVASPSRIVRRREFGRKVFLQIHRTIGLFAGAIFVLVGLSGSILAFREDIDEWLNASIMRVEIPAQPALRPLDEILAAAVAAMPSDGKLERLTMPRHSGSAAAITYMVETDDLDSYFYEMFVDPYTAKVKGQRASVCMETTLFRSPSSRSSWLFTGRCCSGPTMLTCSGPLAFLYSSLSSSVFIFGGRSTAIGGWA